MAIKYPENTSYDIGSVSKTLPSMIKAARQRALQLQQNRTTPGANVRRVGVASPTAGVAATGPTTDIKPFINTGVTISPAFPTGTTISQYKNLTGKNYSFDTPETQYEKKGRYLSPSDVTEAAKFQSMPETLGGGQYVIEPTKPGRAIQSTRATDWKENELIRQGLDPALYQIDHKIPLWAGGSDTVANKEILDNVEHGKKTKMQAIPLTLLANGLIDQREAMSMALNWQEKADTWDIRYPEPNSNGLIDLKDAERIARKWKETPSVTWKSFLSSVPAAGEKIYKAGAKVAQKVLPGTDPVSASIKEFTKGAVAAIPGYNLAMPQLDVYADYNDKAANTAGNVSHVLGSIVGNVVTFGWAYKLALKGLAKAGVGWAAKQVGKEVAEKGSKEAVEAAGKALANKEITADALPEILGTVAKARALKAPDMGAKAYWAGSKIVTAAPKISKAGYYATEILPKAATMGAVSSALGQLRPMEEEQRGERAALDFAYGLFSPVGRAAYTVKGYAKVAAPALTISLMEGLNPSNSFANAMTSALINTGTMVGMHGLGQVGQAIQKSGGKLGGVLTAPEPSNFKEYKAKQQRAIVEAEQKLSNKWREIKYEELNDDIQSGLLRPTDFDVPSAESLKYRKTNKQSEIDRQNAVLNKYTHWKADQEGWHPETTARETLKIFTSGRSLYKGGLSKTARTKADLEDMISYSERMKDPNPDLLTVPKRVKNLANNISEEELKVAPTSDNTVINPESAHLNAKMLITGENEADNPAKMSRIVKAIKDGNIAATPMKDGKYLVNGIVSLEPHLRFPAREGVNPENSLRVYLPNGKHGLEDVGYIATRGRIEGRDDSFNYNRARSVGIDPKTTPLDADIRARHGMADPDINNDRLADEMRKSNTVALKVPILVDPEVASAKIKGQEKSFLMAYVNDEAWDGPSLKKMAEMMSKETGLSMAKTTAATENIVEALKSRPAVKAAEVSVPVPERPIPDVFKPSAPKAGEVKTSEQEMDDFVKWLHSGKEQNTPAMTMTEAIKRKAPKVEMNYPPPDGKLDLSETAIKPTTLAEAGKPLATPLATSEKKPAKISWKNFSQTETGEDGVLSAAREYTSNPETLKSFTKLNLTDLAKKSSAGGTDIAGGWPKFLDSIENKLQSDNPNFKISDKNELNDLRWRYKRMARASVRPELTIENGKAILKPGSSENIGPADKKVKEYNKLNNLPDDSMEIIGISKKRLYDNADGESDSRNKFSADMKALENIDGKKYVPVGITAKGVANTIFVKFEPKVAEKFDLNPSKYSLSDGEKVISPEDKFLRVFAVDVLGLPKDISANDFVKRANLIYNRYDQYSGADANDTIKITNLTSKLIGDNTDVSRDYFVDPKSHTTRAAIESFKKNAEIDGKLIIEEGLYNKIASDTNYDPNKYKTGLKLIIFGDVDTGQGIASMIQKGHAIKADRALKEMLKADYGYEIAPNEIVSFNTNVKVGPKGGSHNIKLSSVYTKPVSVGNDGRIKPTTERKFTSNDKNVAEDMIKETEMRMNDYRAFNEEIKASKNKEEFELAIDKFADKYNLNKDLLFHGPLGESFSLGAAKINLAHNMEKVLKNVFVETVISDALPNSSRAFVSPSFKMKLDGPDKPARYAKNDEAILGAEFMRKNNIKEGDKVMILRDPSVDINNLIVAKAIDGSKLGHTSLGDEHVVVSHFNERVKLQADEDGDTLLIAKIGQGGVPESYANAIIERGSKAIPFTEVNIDAPLPLTMEGVKQTVKNQLVGDDQTSAISVVNRIMDTVADNQLSIKIYPAKNIVKKDGSSKKVSKYELISNGKIVESGETAPSADEFTAVSKWGPAEKELRTQALQEAVDSKKSKDIVVRTEDNNSNWMLKKVFTLEDGNNIDNNKARSLSGALKNVQKIHNLDKISQSSKNLDEVLSKLGPAHKLIGNIKSAGGKLTPLQEKHLYLSEYKGSGFSISNEMIVIADKAGVDAVRAKITDIDKKNPALNDLRKLAIATKIAYGKTKDITTRKNLRKKVEDYYLSNLKNGKYSEKDIDAIAYWAATADEANIKHGYKNIREKIHYPTTKYVFRYKTMINPSKRVAETYYNASEAINANINP